MNEHSSPSGRNEHGFCQPLLLSLFPTSCLRFDNRSRIQAEAVTNSNFAYSELYFLLACLRLAPHSSCRIDMH